VAVVKYPSQVFQSGESASMKTVPILFRKSVEEIPSTTYGTFAIYKYPAKFIPQVIAYVLKNFAEPGMKIFDPFAGYGTVGVVSRVYGHDYILWDLNPILQIIHKVATMKPPSLDVFNILEEIKKSKKEFVPQWSKLNYWFPEEFLPTIAKAWGFVHSLDSDYKFFFFVPLMKVTKFFSYGDEKVHKLYKSKHSKRKIEKLLNSDWENIFYEMLKKETLNLLKKLWEYSNLKPKEVNFKVKSGIDVIEETLEEDVDILITSPPYLQAQEYIRSTKLELFWLGYSEDYVKKLSKKEIPYRKVKPIEVWSEKYHHFRNLIKEPHLKELYDNYFFSILGTFSKLGKKVKKYMCIFVGPAKVRNIPIPIDQIIAEHMQLLGWKHKITFVDTIVSRVMFESEINPASGIKDGRIKTEHLLVLEKQ
jgi:DNA modification methylase